MELSPVESSNIAGAEYLTGDQVMLIRYRDGALYARLCVTPEQYAGFLAASSKGAFVHAMPNRAILISKEAVDVEKEVMPTGPNVRATVNDGISTTVSAGSGNKVMPEPALNVLEADPCCRKAFKRIAPTYGNGPREWTCPDCGTDFASKMVGPVRHWKIRSYVAIVRPQR